MFVRRTGSSRGGRVVAIWINVIMAYFERKGCVKRNLYLNCVSYYNKVFKRYRMVRYQVLVIGGDIGHSACKWNTLFYWRQLQGAVSQRPISS